MEAEIIYEASSPRVYAEAGSKDDRVWLYTENDEAGVEQLLTVEQATALMIALGAAIHAAQAV